MGELPLWHEQQSGIGAAALPKQPGIRCLPGNAAHRTMFAIIRGKMSGNAVPAAGYDNDRRNAGLDIIAGYGRKCGKRHRFNAAGIFLAGDFAVSCMVRENIRRSDDVYGIAVADADGAKEIDCYV